MLSFPHYHMPVISRGLTTKPRDWADGKGHLLLFWKRRRCSLFPRRPSQEQQTTAWGPHKREPCLTERKQPCDKDGAQKDFYLLAHWRSQALKSTWFIPSRGLLIFSSTKITLPLRNGQEIEFSITIIQRQRVVVKALSLAMSFWV